MTAGCGGSSQSGEDHMQNLSGIVLDGYLHGATVCFDSNDNLSCDEGETNTLTNAAGEYGLHVPPDSVGQVVVEVTPDVVDSDTGQTVGSAYTLTAPPGMHGVISPLTTIAYFQGLQFSLSPEDAVAAMQYKTGHNGDLMADYIAANDTAAHDMARIATIVLSRKLAALKALAPPLTTRQALQLAVNEMDMSAIAVATADPSYRTDGNLDADKLAASALATLMANAESIGLNTATEARYGNAFPVKSYDLLGSSAYGSAPHAYVGKPVASQNGVLSASSMWVSHSAHGREAMAVGHLDKQALSWMSGTWVLPVLPRTDVTPFPRILDHYDAYEEDGYHSLGTWLNNNLSSTSGPDDSTYIGPVTNNDPPALIRFSGVDISGEKISAWLPEGMVSATGMAYVDKEATLPSGSLLVAGDINYEKDSYALFDPVAQADSYRAITDVLGKRGGASGSFQMWLSGAMREMVFGPGLTSGTVEFVGIGMGSWVLETVYNEQILVLNPPPQLLIGQDLYKKPILAADYAYSHGHNVVHAGWKTEKHRTRLTGLLNKTAMDALAAAVKRTIPDHAGILRIHFAPGTMEDSGFGVWPLQGWQENTPSSWPADRLPFLTRDDTLWQVRDLAVANGANAVTFSVTGLKGIKSCGSDLVAQLPQNFAATRRADIWVEGCRVAEAPFMRITGAIEIRYYTGISVDAVEYPGWGFSTQYRDEYIEPDLGGWSDRLEFNLSYAFDPETNPRMFWAGKVIYLHENEMWNSLWLNISDKDGNSSCPNTYYASGILRHYFSNYRELEFMGLRHWQFDVDGCVMTTVREGQYQ